MTLMNDPNAYDENGVLRDGYGIDVPFFMMDGNAPPPSLEERIARRIAELDPAVLEAYAGGSPGPTPYEAYKRRLSEAWMDPAPPAEAPGPTSYEAYKTALSNAWKDPQ